MVDFVTSLRAGMSAAEAADRARKEILEVFEELNRQLASAFDGQTSSYWRQIRTAMTEMALSWHFGVPIGMAILAVFMSGALSISARTGKGWKKRFRRCLPVRTSVQKSTHY